MAVLGPHLAGQFAVMLVAKCMEELIIKSYTLSNDGNFSMLDILHHYSSGLKAYITDYAYLAMDEMRQSCGGAGYHMASGVASNW